MVTLNEIKDQVQKLNEKWDDPTARKGLFGNILKTVIIKNIRGIDSTFDLNWPVTVISGTNGSGKTTLLQICSTAYSKVTSKKPVKSGGRFFTLGHWIRAGLTGETPAITESAKVTFTFWDDTPSLDIYYASKRRRWEYPRRRNAERHVEFIGIAFFAPRIEKRDRVQTYGSKLQIKNTTNIDTKILQSISSVLGISYEEVKEHSVGTSTGKWTDKLQVIKRGNTVYAEPHMGAGEQKVVRLIQFLESLPRKSLILLEEPEITLHPDAQKGLAWYLMSLSRRQGHQIIIATHSTEIFETLPDQARILMLRDKKGIKPLHKAPYLRAARELSSSVKTNKDIILVEDEVAQTFLIEILRRHNRTLLENTCIVPIGNTRDVLEMVTSFEKQGIRAIGVRDPDIGQNESLKLFSLPGNKAPESLLLDSENLERAEDLVNGIQDAFDKAKQKGLNLQGSKWDKAVLDALSDEVGLQKDKLMDRLTLAWFNESANNQEAKELVERMNSCFENNFKGN